MTDKEFKPFLSMPRYTNLVILFIVMTTLSGCIDKPEVSVARKFMHSFIKRDVTAARQFVVTEQREHLLQAVLFYFSIAIAMPEKIASEHDKVVSYRGLKFHSFRKDSGSALVNVRGTVDLDIKHQLLSLPFQFNLRMEKRDNKWQVAELLPSSDESK